MSHSPLESLTVVPLASLVLHEAVEARRADAVRAGMAWSGVLTDPIVAAPAPDGRWLVLDGAHRTTALGALGVSAAVIQPMPVRGMAVREIDPGSTAPGAAGGGATGGGATGDEATGDEAGAQLSGWAHDVAGIDPTLLEEATGRFGWGPVDPSDRYPAGGDRPDGGAVVATVAAAGRTAVIRSASDLPSRLAAMWALAGRYATLPYARRQPGDPAAVGTTRITWAPPRPADLVGLAGLGATFPAGVSRFIVRGRVLGVRVPLAELVTAAPGGVVDAVLARRLLDRLGRLPVRLYQEPVWVVEAARVVGTSEPPDAAVPGFPPAN